MSDAAASTPDTPPHRYSAALAAQIEQRWQDRWDADGTFETPNPAGPLADPDGVAARREKLFVLDMFPYPSGAGLHVGHPLGFIGTDVYGRFKRMPGYNVLHTMGFDAFGLPAEQYAVETGQHPRDHDRRTTSPPTAASSAASAWRTTRAARCRPPTPSYYRWTQWIFLQIFNSWYDPDATHPDGSGRARDRSASWSPSSRSGTRPTPDGRPWARADRSTSSAAIIDDHRLAYVSDAPVNWCPVSARSSPTRRSPPTGAPTAATSRCSSATCASG